MLTFHYIDICFHIRLANKHVNNLLHVNLLTYNFLFTAVCIQIANDFVS